MYNLKQVIPPVKSPGNSQPPGDLPRWFPQVISPGQVKRREGIVELVVGLAESLDPGVNRRVAVFEKINLFTSSRRLSRSGRGHRGKSPGEITGEFTGGKSPGEIT